MKKAAPSTKVITYINESISERLYLSLQVFIYVFLPKHVYLIEQLIFVWLNFRD